MYKINSLHYVKNILVTLPFEGNMLFYFCKVKKKLNKYNDFF